MDQSLGHFVVTYPLLSGESHLVEIFGSDVWQFGPFETRQCADLVSVLFPQLRRVSLPMQVRKLDDDALLVLGNARASADMAVAI